MHVLAARLCVSRQEFLSFDFTGFLAISEIFLRNNQRKFAWPLDNQSDPIYMPDHAASKRYG
jgi:hypothetical protein